MRKLIIFFVLILFSVGMVHGEETVVYTGNRVFTGSVSSDTSRSGMEVLTKSTSYDMSESDWGKEIWMTGAGEVGVPDCNASTIGYYVKITNKTATNQIEVAVQDTANDRFVKADGTALDINDELDLATAAMSSVTLECMEANYIYVRSERGTCTDGGVAN